MYDQETLSLTLHALQAMSDYIWYDQLYVLYV